MNELRLAALFLVLFTLALAGRVVYGQLNDVQTAGGIVNAVPAFVTEMKPTFTPTVTPTPTKQPDPGDTDGDGCSDQRENGSDETLGGQRDYKNPWDYYDTNGDGIVDLTNDIFGVITHYAPTGTEPEYDVTYDRGPSAGTSWTDTAPPDGVIDLSNDVLGVIQQYLHDCR